MSKPPQQAAPAGSPTPDARAFREKITALEQALRDDPRHVEDLPIEHHFATGVYVRQLFIPANTVLTGKIHRHDCLNIVVGDIEVATEDGLKRLQGLHVFHSKAGLKRAGRTFSATMWLTVHANPTNERAGERMAELLTVPAFELLEVLASPANPEG